MVEHIDLPGTRRLAILGSGPVGLEAALAGLASTYQVRVYEASDRPSANIRDWGHVRLFSPWSMNVSERMRDRLRSIGSPLEVDEDATSTGWELLRRVLDPLWSSAPLSEVLRLGTRVLSVGREGTLKHEEIATPERGRRPFRILLQDSKGKEWIERADVVLDCTGKYGNPNALGDGGIPAPGERALGDLIESRIPDLDTRWEEWAGRTVLLAGSGHSAQTAARHFAELGVTDPSTRVIWVLRKTDPEWGGVADDPLPGRKELTDAAEALVAGGSPVLSARPGTVVESLSRENGGVRVRLRGALGHEEELSVDRILSLTGGVGDETLYRQLQVHECYAFSAPMKLSAALLGAAGGDCTQQESHGVDTLKNPEPNFFILGDKSYGRNNTFLLRVGWQQVEEVFGELERST